MHYCYADNLFTVSPQGSAAVSPLDIVVNLNDNVTLDCSAMGGPNNTFQWTKNGVIVGNENALNLVAIDASYGGNYTCMVSNGAGTDSVSTILYVAPYFVTPLENQTLTAKGSNVTVFCNVAGFPTPIVNWVDSLGLEVSNTTLLQFNPIVFGQEGIYHCVAKSVINKSTINTTDETTIIGIIHSSCIRRVLCYFVFS